VEVVLQSLDKKLLNIFRSETDFLHPSVTPELRVLGCVMEIHPCSVPSLLFLFCVLQENLSLSLPDPHVKHKRMQESGGGRE